MAIMGLQDNFGQMEEGAMGYEFVIEALVADRRL